MLSTWEAEMLENEGTRAIWEKGSPVGTRPEGLIKTTECALPYQKKVSQKVENMCSRLNTQHAWEADENKFARIFHTFVFQKLGWDFEAEWKAAKARHFIERATRKPPPEEEEKQSIVDILLAWEAEMLGNEDTRVLWERGSTDGTRPNGLVRSVDSALPYQRKVSQRLGYVSKRSKTEHAWIDDENENARIFHAFVFDRLGWDFESEWKKRKKQHDADRANPKPPEDKQPLSDILVAWEAEMLANDDTRVLWERGSPNGTRPLELMKRMGNEFPYQMRVAQKAGYMYQKIKTVHAWDADVNTPARIFHAFVSEKLGWDYKSEWEKRKGVHDAQRTKDDYERAKNKVESRLVKWETEMLAHEHTRLIWERGSTDGTRPEGLFSTGKSALKYQNLVSKSTKFFYRRAKTAHPWEAEENKSARLFHAFVFEKLGWDFESDWKKRKEQHDADRVYPQEEESFQEILEAWEVEMLENDDTQAMWQRGSPDGNRPAGLITTETALPYRKKVSHKVKYMFEKAKTKHDWEAKRNEDVRIFHAFALKKLGWDFETEWKIRKAEHDAERDNPTKAKTFPETLDEWEAEMMGNRHTRVVWMRGSLDGKRPNGLLRAPARTLPFQRIMSQKIAHLGGKKKTQFAWEAEENTSARIFHAFALEKLGWDYESEWRMLKARHDEERATEIDTERWSDSRSDPGSSKRQKI